MHLIGFIIRIYHDARTPERQISHTVLQKCDKKAKILDFSYIEVNTSCPNTVQGDGL